MVLKLDPVEHYLVPEYGRDSNAGLVFSISQFGIVDFVIPQSHWDYGISLRICDLLL